MTIDGRTWSIRQLCREFDVTARALRFYEDKGLLFPSRRGQTRVFHARDRARLKLIVQGKQLGFSLADIREMLDLYDRKDGGAQQLAVSLAKFRRQVETLKQQREAVEAALDTLTQGCAWIEKRLEEFRPDLLPEADRYQSALAARLGDEDAFDTVHTHPPKSLRTRLS
jgi:DNA-binding transcriptional MerR regulator